ncbi:MAG: lipopolysaccharide heptosyltransferase II [Candidatus Omnitrophica bacterium]|nr:lipopolysaccharide heptosyltransferase II [Candidatus Omnitrophota bacterium]
MNPSINLERITKILITRTDRIGDVVLSTPVLEAMRTRFPFAHIALMVSPVTRALVEGNPNLDQVLVYDKSGKEKSWMGTWKFARRLRQEEFDIAIHLHPSNRVHWVSFLARISIRLGYRYKNYRLLTHVIPHKKHEGLKHEARYNFDLLKVLGIAVPEELRTHVPLSERAYETLAQIKNELGLAQEPFIALHPGSSCPSKMWAPSRFAELADRIAEKFGIKTVWIGGEEEKNLSGQISKWMKTKSVDFTAKLNLDQTVWLIKQSRLLISNDSGPVHIAGAVGTPVISIFGRKQPGLGPKRWGPLGRDSAVIHKDVGCTTCAAHECAYSFLCLDAISVEEVFQSVEQYQACFTG